MFAALFVPKNRNGKTCFVRRRLVVFVVSIRLFFGLLFFSAELSVCIVDEHREKQSLFSSSPPTSKQLWKRARVLTNISISSFRLFVDSFSPFTISSFQSCVVPIVSATPLGIFHPRTKQSGAEIVSSSTSLSCICVVTSPTISIRAKTHWKSTGVVRRRCARIRMTAHFDETVSTEFFCVELVQLSLGKRRHQSRYFTIWNSNERGRNETSASKAISISPIYLCTETCDFLSTIFCEW